MTAPPTPTAAPTTGKPPRRRRWIPLSVRILLAVLGLLGLSCVWVGVRGYRQLVAIEEIEKLDGSVELSPAGPRWLRELLGDDKMRMFDDVTGARFGPTVTDAGLQHLELLVNLRFVSLSLSRTRITDAGLVHLRNMSALWSVDLVGTQITDAGLENLKGLSNLKWLRLSDTGVTDAGLAHLSGLNLQVVWLNNTRVTDAGLVHLKGMTELYQLDLHDTKVTKAGLEQLRHLPHIQGLKQGGMTTGGAYIGPAEPTVDNPTEVVPASDEQVARLNEVLWWLPSDTETVCAAHGPFAFKLPAARNTVTMFQSYITGLLEDRYENILADQQVALIVRGSRRFALPQVAGERAMTCEGCQIMIFEHDLGNAGDDLFAAVNNDHRATIEVIHDCDVARIDIGRGTSRWTTFVARPRPNVLLIASDRAYLAEVLARITKKAADRALPESLPEWNYLDPNARQWAIRHFNRQPENDPTSPFTAGIREFDEQAVGLVYSLTAGDIARLYSLSGNERATDIARRSWPHSWRNRQVEVRQLQEGVVEIRFSVRHRQALADFFFSLFGHPGHGAII